MTSNPSKVQQTNVSGTGETTIVTADSMSRLSLAGLIVTTTNAAAATLTLRDGTGGVTKAVLNWPATPANPIQPLVLMFPKPLAQAAKNANWTLQASVNASGFNVSALYDVEV